MGPTGSGKSTSSASCSRRRSRTRAASGVAGKDIGQLGAWKVPLLRRNIGCVFQDFKLLPNKTAYENVAFALEVIGRPAHVIQAQVPQVLDLVGLSKKRYDFRSELSVVSSSGCRWPEPSSTGPILLADEPTGNLDPNTSVASCGCSTASTAPAPPW